MALKSPDVRFCSSDYHQMTPMACTFDALKSNFMDNFFELKPPSGMVCVRLIYEDDVRGSTASAEFALLPNVAATVDRKPY